MIAVFGGSFDPIHYGHLRIIFEINQAIGLDEVRFIPNSIPPHREAAMASNFHRINMLTLALADYPNFKLDLRELERNGVSYMVDTLLSIKDDYPEKSICLILGEDAFAKLDSWFNWQNLFKLAHIIIANRPANSANYHGKLKQEYDQRVICDYKLLEKKSSGFIVRCSVESQNISSSLIRELVKNNGDFSSVLPANIQKYIIKNSLYV